MYILRKKFAKALRLSKSAKAEEDASIWCIHLHILRWLVIKLAVAYAEKCPVLAPYCHQPATELIRLAV